MSGVRSGTGIFLQVRIDSSRLPGKALLPLAGEPVILHAMEALRQVPAEHYLLLTDAQSAPQLRDAARRGGFDIFVGPKEDVLHRYALAARETGVRRFIRATGDNPLVSAEAAALLQARHREGAADYSAYMGLPVGTGVQCVETEALLAADRRAAERYDREHVCPYLYRHPERFTILHPPLPAQYRLPEGRVTLDTRADYRFLERIYADLYRGEPIALEVLVAYLRRREQAAG
jgi:spore coat polysaccharide biosynthesis protein SpsF